MFSPWKRTWLFLCLLIGGNISVVNGAFGAPPIGAKYEKAIGLPVLGRQVFSLHILSDNTAHLLVKGMLILDELVTYTVTSRGCLNCRLSESAQKQLKTFRTTLKEVGYNVETDTPYVKVRTPLPAPVKIHLKRQSVAEIETVDDILSEDEPIAPWGVKSQPIQ